MAVALAVAGDVVAMLLAVVEENSGLGQLGQLADGRNGANGPPATQKAADKADASAG